MRFIFVSLLLCLFVSAAPAFAKDNSSIETVLPDHPGGELWREVRHGEASGVVVSQVKGVDSHVLINSLGDQWAKFRMTVIVEVAVYALLGTILLILAIYAFRGKVKVEGALTDQKVLRFSDYQRVLHWFVASVFLYLAVSGLILLLGRDFLIPILGKELFSIIASASKESHNLFGPIFFISLILMLFTYGRKNLYEKGDFRWLLNVFASDHSQASAGFFNFGEKIWYWLLIIVGLVISVSGFVLVMQNFGQSRLIMELSHLAHVMSALLLIVISFGHIYMGSVGTEAAADGMKTGYVDLNWAKMHHSRWAQHCIDNDEVVSTDEFKRVRGQLKSQKEAG